MRDSSESTMLARLQNCCDLQQFNRLLQELCSNHGFEYYRFGIFRSLPQPRAIFHQHLPSRWLQRYQSEELLKQDPAITLSYQETTPLYWPDFQSDPRLKPQQRQVVSKAIECGLVDGISLPLHGPHHHHALWQLFSCSMMQPHQRQTLCQSLLYYSSYLLQACARVYGSKLQLSIQPLTQRERECLLWVSEGKTSWEIATILSISERTVNYHLAKAAGKTSSCNRYQAIARAIISGKLFPSSEHLQLDECCPPLECVE